METMVKLPSDANITGRNFGKEEMEYLAQVLESGTLNCTKGTWVKEFEKQFMSRYGVQYARSTSSGTAACHTAYAATTPEPGD